MKRRITPFIVAVVIFATGLAFGAGKSSEDTSAANTLSKVLLAVGFVAFIVAIAIPPPCGTDADALPHTDPHQRLTPARARPRAQLSRPVRILGQRVLRREDPRFLTTGGTYVADVRDALLDDCVHLHFVRSTHALAELGDVDVSSAIASAGVHAVFTASDLDVGDMPPVLPRFDPALSPRLLARERVRYVGEPVAVIAADSVAAAVDAAEHVTIEYAPCGPRRIAVPRSRQRPRREL